MPGNPYDDAMAEAAAARRRLAEIEQDYPGGRKRLTIDDLKTMTADQAADRFDEVEALMSGRREVTPEMLANPAQLTPSEYADYHDQIVAADKAAKAAGGAQ